MQSYIVMARQNFLLCSVWLETRTILALCPLLSESPWRPAGSNRDLRSFAGAARFLREPRSKIRNPTNAFKAKALLLSSQQYNQ
jgi:hypothetical protein